ncbi:TPR-like protein [Polyplosphaeria fusca]|uniref:TPR-like protein n=1 Tax=Polyplosphaeria fusca TaxID=682080 RepID=A0A9P4RAP4_9PLEO|nr:TPR-like protein [Polyplosphaeria fusca]
MTQVHKTGLTELFPGIGLNGERPKVNIVFVHGLGGHPQRTWSAEFNGAIAEPEERKSSTDTTPSIRKGSALGLGRLLKRNKTGVPMGLGERSMSAVSMDTTSESLSPGEVTGDPFHAEPESSTSPGIPKSKGKVYWPRDLLPGDFPNARILTFGYDSKLVTLTSTGQRAKLTFTQHAHDLFTTLNQALDDETPIILCVHSLGGVLAKRALWESRTATNPEMQKLIKLTKTVVFFGTPHKGSSKAGWGEIGTQIVSMVRLDSAQHLVSSLKLDSEILDIIHSDFLRLLREGKFYVHTFQEGRPINNVVGKVVEDYSSKIDGFDELQVHEVIDGNHRTMCQFRTPQDAGYRKVVNALRAYMNKLDRKHDIERISLASTFSAREIQRRTYFHIPHERNIEQFVGREECIENIDKMFAEPKNTALVALHGLGGVGKTQVALELAHRWKQFFPQFSIFWVSATTAERFNEGLQGILDVLEIPHSTDTNIRVAVGEWLRDKNNGRWLLVVDNVDSENVLNESKRKGGFKMASCIPKTDHGHVLFTTRYRDLALKLTNSVVRLDQMSKDESMELLKRCLQEQYDDSQKSDAEKLLEELSHIPIAIVQAAAYMRKRENTIADYLELYYESEENRVDLLSQQIVDMRLNDSDSGEEESDIEDDDEESQGHKTVLNTSWMTFSRLKADPVIGPLANDFLSIMSYLDRQEIPVELLKNFKPKIGSIKLNDAFGLLKAYSLVTENSKTKKLSMHRLVQLSMRKWLEVNELAHKYREHALVLLADTFPDGGFETWGKCKDLIVHADAVLYLTENAENRSARAKLLQNCANFQDSRGQYAAAEAKLSEVVKLRTELMGSENAEVLRAMDRQAWTMWSQAKKVKALELSKQTLLKKETLFGEKSAEALTTAHIIATVIGGQGKHQHAAKLHEQNLEARISLFGAENLDTLRSASALSLELWELGKFVDAEDLARKTMETRNELLGEAHPETLEIAGTLGFILEIQGKLVEAKELKAEMLKIRDSIYGEDHPDTADSCHDMGWIHHQMGEYDKAEPYYNRALKAKERLLGETHWKTLTTMCNFPVFLCDKGEYEEAEKRSKKLIAVFTKVQGEQHPQTLDATGGLAVILRHQGKLEEAANAARTSIDGRNIVLGSDHPWTLPPTSHWGYILTLQGDVKQGEAVIRAALVGLEKNLGAEHTNISLAFLAKNLLKQSMGPGDARLQEAEQLARRCLESRSNSLGKDHPYTWKTMHLLGKVMMAQGRHEDAAKTSKQALGGLWEKLGTEHPDVTLCDRDLRDMETTIEELTGKKLGEGEGEVEVIDI